MCTAHLLRGGNFPCLARRNIDHYNTPIPQHPDGLPLDFENKGMRLVFRVTGYLFLLLSLAFLLVRLWGKPKLKRPTRRPPDDYLCIVAWSFTAANTIFILAPVGSYEHSWDMRVTDLKPSYFRRMAAS